MEETAAKEVETWSVRIRTDESIHNTNGLSNAISTTKYSLITWLPKSLWEQFRRIANVYFLVISILMLIGTYATYLFVSPLDPFSTVMTLAFVLLVTSFKEGYEDFQRYRSDRDENIREVVVVTFVDGQLKETVKETQHVKAGDIIKMSGKCAVPVDLLLIMTSMYGDGNQCYIETANIDGETNLKLREAPTRLAALTSSGVPSKELFSGKVEFEPPNKNIHNFIGRLFVDGLDQPISLGSDNILLRSSLFSNTDWAYGIAIYTGQETKIQMNNRHAPSKMSQLEGYLNTAIIIIFVCQVVLVSISVISIYLLGFNNNSKIPYIFPNNSSTGSVLPLWLEQWFVFFLLYNNFIPISLYVTIELVNLGQGFLIGSDLEIYEPSLDCPCIVKSSNLAQELGMVSNIFSDKTGTLTRNEMKFVKFVVNGELSDIPWDGSPPSYLVDAANDTDHVLYSFLRCLTVCHTVVREKNGTYRAESPDELALIEGVGTFNCGLTERSTAGMIINMLGKPQEFEVLAVNQFNSDRKRMSVLVKRRDRDEYILLCKGADNIMLPLCEVSKDQLASVDASLQDLACLGLRTLCVSQKKLREAEAQAWLVRYRDAASSLHNRADMLVEVAAEIEVQMELLGVTAIEDRLQDEVPEVIADLAKAGIVLWMLTGDKEETAINIGRSCNLVLNDTKLFILTKIESADAYHNKLQQVFEDIDRNFQEGVGYLDDGAAKDIALVMDGPSFKYFDENSKDHRSWLLRIGKACRSVIACRLTPIQKQQVVALVKHDTVPRAITLSIGDGANDVSMIREADVGVGIFGKEGRQAANNADFAIGQFKFLKRLLLVHGRWNYNRQAKVFLYCMHKNMVLTLTLFWFSYYDAVSGTSMYESWVYTGFNFILGLPIIFFGIQDRDISAAFAMKNPQVYSTGKENTYLTTFAIGKWILNAILYAIVLCLMFYYALEPSFMEYGLYEMGTTVFTALCLSLQCKVAYLHHQWTWPQCLVMAISVCGMFLYFAIVSSSTTDYYGVTDWLFAKSLYWLFGFFFVPLICMLMDFIGYNLNMFFFPTKEMHYREIEHKHKFLGDLFSGHVRAKESAKNFDDASASNGPSPVHEMVPLPVSRPAQEHSI